jgi:origin recognition complex subunit 1
MRRVVFSPYKRDQLETIVQQRLADAGVPATFELRAIRYAAGKVPPASGFPLIIPCSAGLPAQNNGHAGQVQGKHILQALHYMHTCLHAQVAAVSGDVRRALELCRKAAEIAEEQHAQQQQGQQAGEGDSSGQQAPVVQMAHVDVAITEMFRAVHMQLLGACCRLEKLLLAALVLDLRATGARYA